MYIEMLQAKLHRAVVTDTRLEYPGSLTVDQDLIDRAGMRTYQKIQLVNCNNGSRLETYLISGERGQREVIVNGAAARLAQPGDRVIIIAYAAMQPEELADHQPRVLVLSDHNEVLEELGPH